ncbi:MAG: 50S ribosomal protein L5 [Candidatus Marinimicrobia bacterium]|nr:50S ribosomal protein L5 [Candidatus Neomarinimicrobiota bacterium]
MNGYLPNLITLFKDNISPALQKQLGLKNPYQVPRIQKISLNIGIGNAREEKNALEHAINDLTTITGQKAVVTKAKKAISNFKLRVGDPVGTRVTLRRQHMYEFLERLISIALPRVRDFTGLSVKSFDGRGNYSFGILEQIVFPEIDYDKIDKIRGLDITITTSAKTDEGAYLLLKSLGFPFRLDNRFERATRPAEEAADLEEVK